jgi:hypothetical protein
MFLWIPVLKAQYKDDLALITNLPGWVSVAGGVNIRQLVLFAAKFIGGRITFYNNLLYVLLILIGAVPIGIALLKSIKKYKRTKFYWLWFFIPLGISLLVSLFIPVFNYFRMIFLLPCFYLLIAYGVVRLDKWGKLLAVLITFANIFYWGLYSFDETQHRENWRGAVRQVEAKASENASAVVFNYYLVPAGFRWYSKGYENTFALNDEGALEFIVKNFQSLYYFDYLEDIYDPQKDVKNKLIFEGFSEGEIFDFGRVGQVRYYSKYSK